MLKLSRLTSISDDQPITNSSRFLPTCVVAGDPPVDADQERSKADITLHRNDLQSAAHSNR